MPHTHRAPRTHNHYGPRHTTQLTATCRHCHESRTAQVTLSAPIPLDQLTLVLRGCPAHTLFVHGATREASDAVLRVRLMRGRVEVQVEVPEPSGMLVAYRQLLESPVVPWLEIPARAQGRSRWQRSFEYQILAPHGPQEMGPAGEDWSNPSRLMPISISLVQEMDAMISSEPVMERLVARMAARLEQEIARRFAVPPELIAPEGTTASGFPRTSGLTVEALQRAFPEHRDPSPLGDPEADIVCRVCRQPLGPQHACLPDPIQAPEGGRTSALTIEAIRRERPDRSEAQLQALYQQMMVRLGAQAAPWALLPPPTWRLIGVDPARILGEPDAPATLDHELGAGGAGGMGCGGPFARFKDYMAHKRERHPKPEWHPGG